jgi:hypothetical protein
VARRGAAGAARSGYGEEQLARRGAAMAKSGRRDVLILVSDPASIAALVLSCAGPFRLHGHCMAAACVAAGADCVAISGESTSIGGAGSPGSAACPRQAAGAARQVHGGRSWIELGAHRIGRGPGRSWIERRGGPLGGVATFSLCPRC